MADVTKGYVVVSPGSGSGNTTLSVKAKTPNQGNRVAQNQQFSVPAPGVTPNKTFTAILKAAAEFVTFDDGGEMAVSKSGGQIIITGKSNSDKLTFSKGAGEIIPADISKVTYQANGATATSGTAIAGDPGATAKFNFALTLTADENETITERTQQIIVNTTGNKTATISLKQAAGDAYLTLSATTVEVEQDGSASTIQVNTNTTFTVE